MKEARIILFLMACVLIGAASDALNATGVQTWGHLLDAVQIGLLLSGYAIVKPIKWLPYFLAYVFFRISLFDYAYNLVAGNELFYVGGDNWWDLMLSKQMPSGVLFGRGIFLIAAIFIPIKHL